MSYTICAHNGTLQETVSIPLKRSESYPLITGAHRREMCCKKKDSLCIAAEAVRK